MTTSWTPTSDPEQLRRVNQRERVKEILRSAGDDGFCTFQFNAIGLPNGRNRVYELRDDDGLAIETVSCELERYHADELVAARGRGEELPAHVRFIWHWHGDPRQRPLFRANEV